MAANKTNLSRPIIIAIILVIIVAGSGLAYFLLNKNQDKPSTTTGTSESANGETDCSKISDKDFCKFVTNTSNFSNQPYVAEMITTKDGQESKMTISSDGNGNTKLESNQVNMVTLNGVTYTKVDQTWYKMSLPESSNITGGDIVNDLDLKNLDGINERYKQLGKEACGSLSCMKYEINTKEDDNTNRTTYIWIDTKEHRLRKVEGSYDGGTIVMNITYKDVTISEPSPVQEMPGIGNVPSNP